MIRINRPWLAFWCLVQLAGLAYIFYYTLAEGYLPSPFVHDKGDTFMDFFNPLYWSRHQGVYTEWRSVYPPINFLFLGMLYDLAGGDTGLNDPFSVRGALQGMRWFLLASYLLLPALVVCDRSWRGINATDRALVYVCALSSTPMLFGLERGNLIIFALPLVVLLLSPSPWQRLLSISLLINLKPYFVLLVLLPIMRRNWDEFLLVLLFTFLVFVGSGLFVDQQFYMMLPNLIGFASQESLFSLREVLALPSSVSAFSYVLGVDDVVLELQKASGVSSVLVQAAIELLKWAVELGALLALARRSRHHQPDWAAALLIVGISNISNSVGGYTLLLYLPLVPVLLRQHNARWILAVLLLMALPIDLLPLTRADIGLQSSYISQSTVSVVWTLGLGSLVRPWLNLLLLLLLSNSRDVPWPQRIGPAASNSKSSGGGHLDLSHQT